MGGLAWHVATASARAGATSSMQYYAQLVEMIMISRIVAHIAAQQAVQWLTRMLELRDGDLAGEVSIMDCSGDWAWLCNHYVAP